MLKDLAGGSGVFTTPVEEWIDVDLSCLGVRFPVWAEALHQMTTQGLTRPPDVEDRVFAHAPFGVVVHNPGRTAKRSRMAWTCHARHTSRRRPSLWGSHRGGLSKSCKE